MFHQTAIGIQLNMREKIEQFLSRLKFVKIEDVLSTLPMCVGYIASLFYRLWHRNIWLVCERKSDARDNGYWFYKYMVEKHPEVEAVYAIDKASIDYQKVASLGKVIQFGSLFHWIHYFAAKKNISSQKEGKPNAALCFVLEVYLGRLKNRVFLQHGITKDNARWLHDDVSKISLFCCAAPREFEFIKENFGYAEEKLAMPGFCRFDNLLSEHETKRQILVMPTWRRWLGMTSSDTLKYEKSLKFCDSEYFAAWNSFLNSEKLNQLITENDLELLFYPHPGMQKWVKEFKVSSPNITIADAGSYDMQELLMESAMLITDYSSVYFDFAYLEKPLIYYQFDIDKYRKGQYQQGYFDYGEDGFGAVVGNERDLLAEMEQLVCNGMSMPDKYKMRREGFYAFHDCNNCERTYQAIMKMA